WPLRLPIAVLTAYGLAEIATQAVVFQRNGVEVATDVGVHTRVIEVRERGGTSKHVCLSVICWLNSNIGVAIQTGTGWDELTDDDIFIEAQQRISFAFHRSLCQHASGLLEGRSREPGVCCQRCLGDTHQLVTARSGTLTFSHGCTVGCHECYTVGKFTWQQVGIAGINNGDSTQHLSDDD